jgi:excisionase family DNA binding protein
MKKGNLTTGEAAKRLKVTPRRVVALITDERLPARKCECGKEWIIKESDLALVAERKAGRPRKDAPK